MVSGDMVLRLYRPNFPISLAEPIGKGARSSRTKPFSFFFGIRDLKSEGKKKKEGGRSVERRKALTSRGLRVETRRRCWGVFPALQLRVVRGNIPLGLELSKKQATVF
jgi:hypothetical protein